jgi:hypothetical protein
VHNFLGERGEVASLIRVILSSTLFSSVLFDLLLFFPENVRAKRCVLLISPIALWMNGDGRERERETHSRVA